MSARDLAQLRSWATEQADDLGNTLRERRLWRRIAGEVEAYQGGLEVSASGAPLCRVCREPDGRHRSTSTGRYVAGHDAAAAGLLW